MMVGGTELQVLVATRPVDFRKQADTLAAFVQQARGVDPYSGAVYVFRAKRADRVKLLWWGCQAKASPLIETTPTRRTTDSAPACASSSFHSGTLRILEQSCPDQKRPTRRATFRPTGTGGSL